MSYKDAKEEFVSGSKGGSVTKINLVCLTALTTYALWSLIAPSLTSSKGSPSLRLPLIEFTILIVPLLLSLTLLSSHPLLLNTFLTSLIILLRTSPNLFKSSQDLLPPPSPSVLKKEFDSSPPLPPSPPIAQRLFSKPFVTVYRAHMMLMTVICILAVDFKIFPREFAKAETWGTSLMDLGVGSFVFSLGIVSALPLLRDSNRTPFLISVWTSIKKGAGVIALGLIRVLMVKGVDLPEHVSEYGVHWNFFFTLGLLPIFGAALEPLAPLIDLTWIALAITFVHQMLLDQTMLQYWTLTALRTDLISQNKEGLVSLPGYLSIYLLGLTTGLYILPPDPYYFTRLRPSPSSSSKNSKTIEKREEMEMKLRKARKDKPGKVASVLGSYAILWWGFYWSIRGLGWGVSRRLANLPYVLWIAAFNTSFLLCYLVIHMWTTSIHSSSSSTTSSSSSSHHPTSSLPSSPAIFDAINRNGLLVFLIANLLTGLVNLSMKSMYASDWVAMIVLVMYLLGVVGAAWGLRNKRLRI